MRVLSLMFQARRLYGSETTPGILFRWAFNILAVIIFISAMIAVANSFGGGPVGGPASSEVLY